MDKEEDMIDELMEDMFERSFDQAINVTADRIAKQIRQDLKEQDLVEKSQQWMVKALLRHVLSRILMRLKKTLKKELKKAGSNIKQETMDFVRQQVDREDLLKGPSAMRRKQSSTSSGVSGGSGTDQSEMEEELEEYKQKVLDLSSQLNRVFNTLLNIYPELQAIPIIERTGSIRITKLCRSMDKSRKEIMPFLEKMEEHGIVKLEGDRVKNLRALFKGK